MDSEGRKAGGSESQMADGRRRRADGGGRMAEGRKIGKPESRRVGSLRIFLLRSFSFFFLFRWEVG